MEKNINSSNENKTKFEKPKDLSLTIFLAFLSIGFIVTYFVIFFDLYKELWISLFCIFGAVLVFSLATIYMVFLFKHKNFKELLSTMKLEKLTSLIDDDDDDEQKNGSQIRIVLAGNKGIGKSRYMEKEIMQNDKKVIKKNFLKIDFTSYEINDVKSIEKKLKTLNEYWSILLKTLYITIPTLALVFFQISGAESQLIYNVVTLSTLILFFILTFMHLIQSWNFSMKNVVMFENLNRIHYSAGDTLNSDEVIQMIPKVKKLKNKIMIFEVENLFEFGGDNVQLDPKYTTHYLKIPTDPGVYSIILKKLFIEKGFFDSDNKQLESLLRVLIFKYEFNLRILISVINGHNHIYNKKENKMLFERINLDFLSYVFIIEILKYINENTSVWIGEYRKHFKNIEIISTESYLKNDNVKVSFNEVLTISTLELSESKFLIESKFEEIDGKTEKEYSIKKSLYEFKLSNPELIIDLHIIKMLAALSNDIIKPFEPGQESILYGTSTYENFLIKTNHFDEKDFIIYFESLFKLKNDDLTKKILEVVEKIINDDKNFFNEKILEFINKNKSLQNSN